MWGWLELISWLALHPGPMDRSWKIHQCIQKSENLIESIQAAFKGQQRWILNQEIGQPFSWILSV